VFTVNILAKGVNIMAKVKVEGIVNSLDYQFKNALEDAVKSYDHFWCLKP